MRLPPRYGPQAYKTYQMAAPLRTHWSPVTCEEVGCAKQRDGFWIELTPGDPASEQAKVAITTAYRPGQYTISAAPDGSGDVRYTFEVGTPCFEGRAGAHKVRNEDRAPLYIIKDGDFRGNPRGTKPTVCDGAHEGWQMWAEQMSAHAEAINR